MINLSRNDSRIDRRRLLGGGRHPFVIGICFYIKKKKKRNTALFYYVDKKKGKE